MAEETAQEQVPLTPSFEDQLTPHQRQQLAALKERVYNGIRWGGWRLDKDGNDVASLAMVYALEPNKPLGFNKRVAVPSVANEPDHRTALMDGVIALVEEFVRTHLGKPSIDILSASDDPIWDQSPMTGFGRIGDALTEGPLPEPEVEVVEEEVPQALANINRAAVESEVNMREFGKPRVNWGDIVKSALQRRL
jgi:hypothetical protein